jgi:hypothetical protein
MNNREQTVQERYELIRERMDSLCSEDMTGLFRKEFLTGMALFLRDALRVCDLYHAQVLDTLSWKQQKKVHDQLYLAPVWEALMPAEEKEVLQAAGQEWRLAAGYAMTGQKFFLTAAVELFLQIYSLFEMEREKELTKEERGQSVRRALYYHFCDYFDVTTAWRYEELLQPGRFMEELYRAGQEEYYGLFRLGGQVDEQAFQTACFLRSLSEKEIRRRAEAYFEETERTDGRKAGGFRVAIVTAPGWERLGLALARICEEQGSTPVLSRRQETLAARLAEGEEAFALSLFADNWFRERRLCEEQNAREAYRDDLAELAAVITLSGNAAGANFFAPSY